MRALFVVAVAATLAAACGGAPSVTSPIDAPSLTRPAPTSAPPAASHQACAKTAVASPKPLEPGRGDRVVLARDAERTFAFVANEDDGAIHTVDVDAAKEVAVTAIPGAPSALVMLGDGRLAIAVRDRNEVLLAEPDADGAVRVLCRQSAPSEPVGLALAPPPPGGSTHRLLVTSRYGRALTVFDAAALSEVGRFDVGRDPQAVVARGAVAYVSHVTSSEVTRVDLDGGATERIDLFRRGPHESPFRGGQAFSIAAGASGRMFFPMVTTDPGEPKITSAYGGVLRPINPLVAVLDAGAGGPLPATMAMGDKTLRDCMLPRAAALAPDHRLLVTCAGIDELLVLDARADDPSRAVRRRVRVPSGPVGVAVDDAKDRAVVLGQFDREIAIVALGAGRDAPERVGLSRPASGLDEAFERGRRVFHDSFDLRVSADGRACASCHPDGRDDGLTWSTPDGPRQTITLAGRVAGSAPYGWFGEHRTLEEHLEHTMRRLGGRGFAGADLADLQALASYVLRMKGPVASAEGASGALAKKGRALFHDAAQGCGSCHTEGGTDRARYDVGSGNANEASTRFDTPSLAQLAGSGPYFHDGRYGSMRELVEKGDHRMGRAMHLGHRRPASRSTRAARSVPRRASCCASTPRGRGPKRRRP